jgi:threonine/homoserine/homoserine lactone efflux protein
VNLMAVLPMALVMIAGPQILSAIFLATTEGWRRNSIAYISGAAVSMTVIVTAAYFASREARDQGASSDAVNIVIVVLLVGAAFNTYRTREEAEPPSWMGKLQAASAGFSFKLGVLLLGLFPTNILTLLAVGSYLSNEGSPWWQCLPFLALTLFLLSGPLILLLAFGDRAQAFLPKARDWMSNNSWIVSELVIGLFIVITANSLA